MDTFLTKLKQFGHARANVMLAKHTSFKIGGPARFFVEVEDSDKLVGLLNFLNEEGMDYFILGGGSNVLFSDEGYDGVVVKVCSVQLAVNSTGITADAGVKLADVVNGSAEYGLTGLEWAAGIPGTVGGATRGNAGAFGEDTSQSVEYAEVWRNGEILKLKKEECEFGYRDSAFKTNGDIILRVIFHLAPGVKKDILAKIQKNLSARGHHPRYPSSGSFFKNIKIADLPFAFPPSQGGTQRGLPSANDGNSPLPPLGKRGSDDPFANLPRIFLERGTIPAGWLIEQCGLKGLKVGGAKVSEEHGNFIINFKNATQADVLALVEKVKEAVYNKYKIELQEEVNIIK